jgi:nucleotidyltransferase substrate binding protein (TIGR01987 family)
VDALKVKLSELIDAVEELGVGVDYFERAKKNIGADDDPFRLYRDAVIKRFEFSFDLLWKALKELLREKYGIDVASPKKVFQQSGDQGIVTEQEVRKLLNMCDDRNMTVHGYDEKSVHEIAERVVKNYFKLFQDIVKKIDYR